jgi:hypothetical protein
MPNSDPLTLRDIDLEGLEFLSAEEQRTSWLIANRDAAWNARALALQVKNSASATLTQRATAQAFIDHLEQDFRNWLFAQSIDDLTQAPAIPQPSKAQVDAFASAAFAASQRLAQIQSAADILRLATRWIQIANGNIGGTTAAEALSLSTSPLKADLPLSKLLYVNARDGLRVRAGPGTNFEIRSLALDHGTAVAPIRTQEGWTLIDTQGDGKADGYVSSGYLSDKLLVASTLSPEDVAPQISHTPDASKIAALIGQGSTADGLKRARATATSAMAKLDIKYPTNGCAAHLSALLEQAAIKVPMTFGAGKLAHLLAERSWRRVPIGQQAPGDVGVCFDNDPTPAGADHVYLVIETLGPDRMMIADNQNPKDAPHERFASGRGKTPTEYFLRA